MHVVGCSHYDDCVVIVIKKKKEGTGTPTRVAMHPRTKVVSREHCQERWEKKRCMRPKHTMIFA